MTLSTCSRRTQTRWWWSRTTCCPHGLFGSRTVTDPAIAVRPGPANADQVQLGTCLESISSPIADARGLRVYRSVRRLHRFVKQGLFRARQPSLRMVLEIQTVRKAHLPAHRFCLWPRKKKTCPPSSLSTSLTQSILGSCVPLFSRIPSPYRGPIYAKTQMT